LALLALTSGCTNAIPDVSATYDKNAFWLNTSVVTYNSLKSVEATGKCSTNSTDIEYSLDDGTTWKSVIQTAASYEFGCQTTGRFKVNLDLLFTPAALWFGMPQGNYHILYRAVLGSTENLSDVHNLVLKPANLVLDLLAGTYGGGSGRLDGPLANARFNGIQGTVVDSHGNLLVIERNGGMLRKIAPDGVVSTVVNNPDPFLLNPSPTPQVDGDVSVARLFRPTAIAIDSSDNIFVADTNPYSIRKITPDGQVTTYALSTINSMANGYRLTAGFGWISSITVSPSGDLYFSDTGYPSIRKIDHVSGALTTVTGDGNQAFISTPYVGMTATSATIGIPGGLAFDSSGNLFIVDTTSNVVYKINAAGSIFTFAGAAFTNNRIDGNGTSASFRQSSDMTIDPSGNLYVISPSYCEVRKITSGALVTTLGPAGCYDVNTITNINFGVDQTLYMNTNDGVYRITAAGQRVGITAKAGDYGNADGDRAAARLTLVYQSNLDNSGNILALDQYTSIRKVTPAGNISTSYAWTGYGCVDGPAGTGKIGTIAAFAVDSTGLTWIADSSCSKIRTISANGTVTTVAGSGTAAFGDGIGTAASFRNLRYMKFDVAGNIILIDHYAVRKLDTITLQVSTIAGTTYGYSNGYVDGNVSIAVFDYPTGLAIDKNNNIFISEGSVGTLRKITPAGNVMTIAGIKGTRGFVDGALGVATLQGPRDITFDEFGNLCFLDANGSVLRRLTVDGKIETLFGSPFRQGVRLGSNSEATLSVQSFVVIKSTFYLFMETGLFTLVVP
jgi:sugar lactone lactonase YvrE